MAVALGIATRRYSYRYSYSHDSCRVSLRARPSHPFSRRSRSLVNALLLEERLRGLEQAPKVGKQLLNLFERHLLARVELRDERLTARRSVDRYRKGAADHHAMILL